MNIPPLQYLYRYNASTQLCIREDTRDLVIAKTIPAEAVAVYRALSGIHSPVLPVIYGGQEEPDGTYTVIRDYVAGKSLAAHLADGRHFSREEVARFGAELCDGLCELHTRGLVHRDICPNNIIPSPDGHVHIIDFGIARTYSADKTGDTLILGTPGYAAPEQFGFTQSNAKTDIYALGVLLTVLLTGELPLSGKPIPGRFGRILRRCTAMDAKNRYPDARCLQNALLPFATPKGRGDRFLAGIPGLRSPHLPVVILSAVFYLAAFFFIGCALCRTERGVQLISDAVFIFLFFIFPFCCFFNAGYLWERFPLTANSSRRTQRILFFFIGLASMLVGSVVLSIAYSLTHAS